MILNLSVYFIFQLDEEYVLRLGSYGPKGADIGAKSTINITIPKNDDPHGVYHFDPNALHKIIGKFHYFLLYRSLITLK